MQKPIFLGKPLRLRTDWFVVVCAGVVSVHALLLMVAALQTSPSHRHEQEPISFHLVNPVLVMATNAAPSTNFQNDAQKTSQKNDVLKPINRDRPAQKAENDHQRAEPVANLQVAPAFDSTAQAADQRIETVPTVSKAPMHVAHTQMRPQIELPSKDAEYLHHAVPVYPAISQRLNEQGKVMVRVLISTEGMPLDVELFESSGFDRLDRSAIQAVKGWRFVPGRKQGNPEKMWFTVPVNFQLTN